MVTSDLVERARLEVGFGELIGGDGHYMDRGVLGGQAGTLTWGE